MIDQRLARLQPDIEHIVAGHLGHGAATVSLQRRAEQIVQHRSRGHGVRVLVEDRNSVHRTIIHVIAEGIVRPAHRFAAAEQRFAQRPHVPVESVRVGGEHLSEAAADIQHRRAESAAVGALDQLEAGVDGSDAFRGVTGVDMKGEAEERDSPAIGRQQIQGLVHMGQRHTEPAHRCLVESGNPQQHRNSRAVTGQFGDPPQLPQIVDIDGDTAVDQITQERFTFRPGHLDPHRTESGPDGTGQLLRGSDIDGDTSMFGGAYQGSGLIHLVRVADSVARAPAVEYGAQLFQVLRVDLWKHQVDRGSEANQRLLDGIAGIEKGAHQRMDLRG